MYEILTLIFALPFAIIGLFIIIKVLFLEMKPPADTSNRIAHLRLVWFAITRPEIFTPYFEWLKRDELENLKE